MTTFMTVEKAITWIESQTHFPRRQNLDKMRFALSLLGNPHMSYPSVHIAGTNGKGSTASFTKTILIEAGYRVGVYVSPYIIKFNERIAIGNEIISDDDLLLHANAIYQMNQTVMEEFDEGLSFFELITVIAFEYFSHNKIDYAIIEVGLGGLLDATNVIDAAVSLITNIGYDHMKTLGNTLEEIAFNKLGIVKKGNHLITTVDQPLHKLFHEYIMNCDASMDIIDTQKITIEETENTAFTYHGKRYEISLIGLFQAYNASLAIAAIHYLIPTITEDIIQKGLKHTVWPGRLEKMSDSPPLYLDGAHNIHGIEALAKTLKTVFKNRNIHIIFCAMADKELKHMINALDIIATTMTFTEIAYYRSAKAQDLTNLSNHPNPQCISNLTEAIKTVYSVATKQDMIILTGSLYFISEARKLLKGMI